MLYFAPLFLVFTLIAGVLGFGGIAGIAQGQFFFLAVPLIFFVVVGLFRKRVRVSSVESR